MKTTLIAAAAALAATLSGCVAVPVEGPVYAAPPPPPVVFVRPAYRSHYYHHHHYRHGPYLRRHWR